MGQKLIKTRVYGTSGPYVILLHGGPGAAGYMAPVARELAGSFRVLEPFQRGSGREQLTVARHIADLDEVIKAYCRDQKPIIVGHSWGAMLALAYAAEHPGHAASLILIGCGTFDSAARDTLRATCKERMNESFLHRIEQLPRKYSDPDERLAAMGRLMQKIDSYKLISPCEQIEKCDARAHEESWQDMLRLQAEGIYPAAFAKINVPVIMMHGAYDPHPGQMIYAGLKRYLPELEYRQWDRCGHYPWLEKAVRDEFYAALREWLRQSGRLTKN